MHVVGDVSRREAAGKVPQEDGVEAQEELERNRLGRARHVGRRRLPARARWRRRRGRRRRDVVGVVEAAAGRAAQRRVRVVRARRAHGALAAGGRREGRLVARVAASVGRARARARARVRPRRRGPPRARRPVALAAVVPVALGPPARLLVPTAPPRAPLPRARPVLVVRPPALAARSVALALALIVLARTGRLGRLVRRPLVLALRRARRKGPLALGAATRGRPLALAVPPRLVLPHPVALALANVRGAVPRARHARRGPRARRRSRTRARWLRLCGVRRRRHGRPRKGGEPRARARAGRRGCEARGGGCGDVAVAREAGRVGGGSGREGRDSGRARGKARGCRRARGERGGGRVDEGRRRRRCTWCRFRRGGDWCGCRGGGRGGGREGREREACGKVALAAGEEEVLGGHDEVGGRCRVELDGGELCAREVVEVVVGAGSEVEGEVDALEARELLALLEIEGRVDAHGLTGRDERAGLLPAPAPGALERGGHRVVPCEDSASAPGRGGSSAEGVDGQLALHGASASWYAARSAREAAEEMSKERSARWRRGNGSPSAWATGAAIDQQAVAQAVCSVGGRAGADRSRGLALLQLRDVSVSASTAASFRCWAT